MAGAKGVCPNCDHPASETIDSKAFVTELRECASCKMMYRFPADTERTNHRFYQKAYSQGFTTSLPGDEALSQLLRTKFEGHEKSYRVLIGLVEQAGLRPGSAIFDFGCSWGFGSWQFRDHGFSVRSFEISAERAEFARAKLAIDCISDPSHLDTDESLRGRFDMFFSNHVMEHVPKPGRCVAIAKRLTRPGGIFFAVTPNGSPEYRAIAPRNWHLSWGEVHPNLISDTFWSETFHKHDYFIGSLPLASSRLQDWAQTGGQVRAGLAGPELLCVARL